MMPPLEPKTPAEEKDYGVDWSHWLAADVTIDTSAWEVATPNPSPGIAVETDNIDGQTTLARVSGGAEGEDYVLYNNIETSVGEILQQAIKIRVKTPEEIAGL